MWPVSVTQLGVYYIRKRLLHVPTAFHGHGATKQINGLAYLHDIKGVRELNCNSNLTGASVAKWLAHLPFTSEAAGSSLSENFLNATRTQSSCEKSKSQRSAESRGFPPDTPVSSHRES